MRSRSAVFAAAVLVLTGAWETATGRSSSKPLNILFILADDLGWRDLGCFESSFYETPRVDALAARGMSFTNAYAAAPVCSPTRASILTGKHPARLKTTDYFGAPQPDDEKKHWTRDKPLLPARYLDRLPLEETTLAEALKEAGYATFFAGKWHLGPEGHWPEDQGFDVNRGGITRGGPYGGKRYFSPYGNPRLEDGPDGEHLPLRLARETAAFIEQHREDPFLAYLSFYSVHTPLMAREELERKYRKKQAGLGDVGPIFGTEGERQLRLVQEHPVYAGMVEALDEAVGIVLDELDRLELRQRTAIIFMSDNGGLSTSEGHPTSNLPLRAGKGWLYEGGIRVPLLVDWPGVTAPGSHSDVPVQSTDFYPTLLEMAGLPARPEQHLDGQSLVPILTGRGPIEREALYFHYPHYGNQGGSPGSAVRVGDWKLIEWFEDSRSELFDLTHDPGETTDRAALEPDRVRQMSARLHAWREALDAELPSANR